MARFGQVEHVFISSPISVEMSRSLMMRDSYLPPTTTLYIDPTRIDLIRVEPRWR